MSLIMCDWITASILRTRSVAGSRIFDTGRFQKVSPDGEVLEDFASRLTFEGSYSNIVTFRAPTGNQLELSGNPAKFLQGHNLFGSGDFLGLFLDTGMKARRSGEQFPGPQTFRSNEFAPPKFTRLDLTRSYRFASNEEARTWLRNTGQKGHAKFGGAMTRGETIYFGKNSTRWSLKIYPKFDELSSKKKGHELSVKIKKKDQDLLKDWAQGVVRFELTLRSPEIKRIGSDFDNSSVWDSYYNRIQFNKNGEVFNMTLLDDVKLSPSRKIAIQAWFKGTDLKQTYKGKNFYKVRRDILEVTGLDVSVPYSQVETSLGSTELVEKNWDPAPIDHLAYVPDDRLKIAYGLN